MLTKPGTESGAVIVRRWILIVMSMLSVVASVSTMGAVLTSPASSTGLDESAAGRFAHLALACAHKEYPNKIAHVLASEGDVMPPHLLTPAFYGCFDWHSAVHGHWLLVRLFLLFPAAPFAKDARASLAA